MNKPDKLTISFTLDDKTIKTFTLVNNRGVLVVCSPIDYLISVYETGKKINPEITLDEHSIKAIAYIEEYYENLISCLKDSKS